MPQLVFDASSGWELRKSIMETVAATLVTDIHTHLYAPHFGPLLLWGVDELLTYHYLIAEFFRASDMPAERFWKLKKPAQAEAIWNTLFVNASPISEACRGVLTALNKMGIDTGNRDLSAIRAQFSRWKRDDFVDRVFEVAHLKCVVMTNDPFDPAERKVWEKGTCDDARFQAALRIDPLLNAWEESHILLGEMGYDVSATLSKTTLARIRRFLSDWIKKTKALYMAVSLPPDFAFPENSSRARIIEECVLPVAREFNIPFAMMIGVKRNINPEIRLAGDGVDRAVAGAVERICAAFPQNKFMVTMLSRENQHTLCVAARKFRNLMPFGCWWFLNVPSLIQEMTRMRLELLGTTFIPQHSDARVLDQVIYKWEHSRAIIADVLVDKYNDMLIAGWRIAETEIRRDVESLLGGAFWDFLERKL